MEYLKFVLLKISWRLDSESQQIYVEVMTKTMGGFLFLAYLLTHSQKLAPRVGHTRTCSLKSEAKAIINNNDVVSSHVCIYYTTLLRLTALH